MAARPQFALAATTFFSSAFGLKLRMLRHVIGFHRVSDCSISDDRNRAANREGHASSRSRFAATALDRCRYGTTPGNYKFMVYGSYTPNQGISQPFYSTAPQVFVVNVTIQ
jgi:hypothetical protein